MNLSISSEQPRIMHIDLNSAFATTEQQARPSLRGKPIGITNRISPYCCIIAASFEAKKRGVKVGMRLDQAKQIIPEFIVLESDPPKYHHIYKSLVDIMSEYSPNVAMKSIDEGVIDFHNTDYVNNRSLVDIGHEIKQKVTDRIGSWMKINVGIAPNRFLAKTASNLHKPDGLDIIDKSNLRRVFSTLKLTDLTGIASHFEARLNAANIFTPTDFLNASSDTLKRLVFHSTTGEDWYLRLRGYEIDNYTTKLGNVGRQFALDTSSTEDKDILPRFHYLCETTGKKLRYNNVDARGILVWADYKTGDNWYQRKMYNTSFYTDREIYQRALQLFNKRPKGLSIARMGITCYMLSPSSRNQVSLFDEINKQEWLTEAIDNINERFGIFIVGSADAALGQEKVKQKIPFGSTKYFDLLLKSKQTKG
jgi:DNA polymerase-4